MTCSVWLASFRPVATGIAPPVEPVKGVAPYIMGKFTGLTYSGHNGKPVRLDFKLYHGLSECFQNTEIAASGTPGRCATLVIIQ